MHRLLLLLLVAVYALSLSCCPAAGRPSMARYTRDREDLVKTLSFLKKLDGYYSNVARPRFGKRASVPIYFDAVEIPEETPVYRARMIIRR